MHHWEETEFLFGIAVIMIAHACFSAWVHLELSSVRSGYSYILLSENGSRSETSPKLYNILQIPFVHNSRSTLYFPPFSKILEQQF